MRSSKESSGRWSHVSITQATAYTRSHASRTPSDLTNGEREENKVRNLYLWLFLYKLEGFESIDFVRHAHEAAASDMKDEKPPYAFRTVIRMIWAVKSVQIVGLRSRVCETSHMNLSET